MLDNQPVHLGSWVFFSDLSGQVTTKLANPIITAVAVAIPKDLVSPLRTQVRRQVPAKWKTGRLAGLSTVVGLIERHGLRVAVSQLHVADEAKWETYIGDGEAFRQMAVARAGKPLHYLQPELWLRAELLMRPSAHIMGRLLSARHQPEVEAYRIDIEVVTDTDLRTQDTVEQFRVTVLRWPEITRVRQILGLHPTVLDVRCETEQVEPLLMLPDYLAGVYQHADTRTRLAAPVVSGEEAVLAVEQVRRQLGEDLFVDTFDFDDMYPLGHDAVGRVFHIRDRRPTTVPEQHGQPPRG
jgi:hypothetical protein